MGRRLLAGLLALAVLTFSVAADAGWAYRRALSKATEKGEIYDPGTWEARIIWHATFFSDAFRPAFEKRHIDITHISRENAEAFHAQQGHRQETGWTFFVALYTKEPYKKLTAFDDSFWKLTLRTARGELVEPSAIDHFPVDPYALAMFPYLDRWSKIYRVTFPKVALGNEIELTISSVVGESTLHWKIKDEEL